MIAMNLTEHAIKFQEEMQRVNEKCPVEEQELNEQDQITFLMMNEIFPKDRLFRLFITEATACFAKASSNKGLMRVFLMTFIDLCDMISNHPLALTKEKAQAKLREKGII